MPEGFQKLLLQTVEVHTRRLAPGNDIHINCRQRATIAPECFPDIPFNPVTGHRTPYLFTHGNPQPGMCAGTGPPHDKYSPGAELICSSCQAEKLGTLAKPDFRWKCTVGDQGSQAVLNLFRSNTDGKVFSSLGPSALDNQTAVFTGHPYKKTVGSFTGDIARLIRSFHVAPQNIFSRKEFLLTMTG